METPREAATTPAGSALIPYTSDDPVARMEAVAGLGAEALHRLAAEACLAHDADALWRLTEAYLIAHGRRGAVVSPYTLRNYRQGVLSLLDAWRDETLLKPHRNAATR